MLSVSPTGGITRSNDEHERLTTEYYERGIADAKAGRPRIGGIYGDRKDCYNSGYRRGLREVSNNDGIN